MGPSQHPQYTRALYGGEAVGSLSQQHSTARKSTQTSTTWKVMHRNAWKDIANLQTNRLNNCTKSQLHVLTITNSKKKRKEICWRIVKSMRTNCSEMLVFGSIW